MLIVGYKKVYNHLEMKAKCMPDFEKKYEKIAYIN